MTTNAFFSVVEILEKIAQKQAPIDCRTIRQAAKIINLRYNVNHPSFAGHDAALSRGRPARLTKLALAYLYLNPDMLPMRTLAQSLDIVRQTASIYRSRRRTTLPDAPRGVSTTVPIPLDPHTGLYYHEMALPNTIELASTPFYLFHATAWAGYVYGALLQAEIGPDLPSPYHPPLTTPRNARDYMNGVTVHHDPTGRIYYAGPAYLDAAQRFYTRNPQSRYSLPVPMGRPVTLSRRQLGDMLREAGAALLPAPPRGRPAKEPVARAYEVDDSGHATAVPSNDAAAVDDLVALATGAAS